MTQVTYNNGKRMKDCNIRMLIIDGNSVFEIDEECLKRKEVLDECDVKKYFDENYECSKDKQQKKRL